jgi:hypothetical protein
LENGGAPFFKKVLNSTFSKNLDAFNFILGMLVEYFKNIDNF